MPWYGFALTSAAAIALVGLLEKKTLQKEHSLQYVAMFSLVKLGLFLLVFGRTVEWTISIPQGLLMLVDSVIGAGAFFMITKAIRRLELSTVMPLLSLDAGLTAILAWIFLGEYLNFGQFGGLTLLVLGAYLLELRHFSRDWWRQVKLQPRAIFRPLTKIWREPGGKYAVIGVILFSTSSVMDRSLLQQISVTTFLGYAFTIQGLIFFVAWLRRKKSLPRPAGIKSIWLLIVLAAGLHLLSNYAQAQAVGLAAVGLVVAVKRLATLFDVIIGGTYFHEHFLPQKIAATIFMLVGVYFIVR